MIKPMDLGQRQDALRGTLGFHGTAFRPFLQRLRRFRTIPKEAKGDGALRKSTEPVELLCGSVTVAKFTLWFLPTRTRQSDIPGLH